MGDLNTRTGEQSTWKELLKNKELIIDASNHRLNGSESEENNKIPK